MKKYVTCIMAFFTLFNFVTSCQFYLTTFPVSFFAIWLLQRSTLYQQRYKTTFLNTTESLNTYVLINNPHWQSSGIIIFLCKYYIIISGTLVGSFLDVLFLLLVVILELHEKPKRKDWVTEKSTLKNLCKGYHFFDCTS